MRLHLLLTVCLLSAGMEVSGQQLFGQLKDLDTGEPLVGASVIFKNGISEDIIDFRLSDGKGQFQYDFNTRDSLLIEARMMGYHPLDTALLLTEAEKDIILGLRVQSLELGTVEVKSYKTGIIRNGDTLTYDPEVFSISSDENLKDLLQRLPGIDVEEDGRIMANGKEIDKVLVEGDDLMNNSRNTLLEIVRAGDVEDVQLIGDYRSSDVPGGMLAGAEKNALNIRLAGEAKGKWRGSVRAGAGVQNKWQADANAFRLGLKFKVFAAGRANNTAQHLLSPSDFHNLNGGLISYVREPSQVKLEMPSLFSQQNQYASNRSYFPNVSYSYQVTDKLKLNGYLMAFGSDNTSLQEREVLNADLIPLFSQRSTSQGQYRMGGGGIKAAYQLLDKTNAILAVQHSSQKDAIQVRNESTTAEGMLTARNNPTDRSDQTSAKLLLHHQYGKGHSLAAYVHAWRKKEKTTQRLSLDQPIRFSEVITGQADTTLTERSTPRLSGMTASVRHEKETANWKAQSKVDIIYENDRLRHRIQGDSIAANWRNNLKNYIYQGGTTVGRNWGHLKAKVGLTGRIKRGVLSDQLPQRATLFDLLPEALVTYQWPDRMRQFTLSYRQSMQTHHPHFPVGAFDILDERALNQPLEDRFTDQLTNGLSLFVFDFDVLSGVHYALFLNYNRQNNQIGQAQEFSDGFVLRQAQLVNGAQWTGSVQAEKKLFDWQASIKLKSSFQHLRAPVRINEREVEQALTVLNLAMDYASLYEGAVNFDLGVSISTNQLSDEQNAVNSRNIAAIGKVVFHDSKDKIILQYNPTLQVVAGDQQWFHFINGEVQRDITPSLQLSIEGNNLLHLLQGNTFERFHGQQSLVERVSYQTIEGFAMLNVRWAF